MNDYAAKLAALQAQLAALPGAVIAFSGGVDSSMLLHLCAEVLGTKVLAVTADSASLPRAELAEAQAFTAGLGVRHVLLATQELSRPEYRRNDGQRCYHCKSELFAAIAAQRGNLGDPTWPVLYGAIADDALDDRPGARAASEHRVLAPLADCGFTKADVRRYSREHGLATAEKPAMACLASRVAAGMPVLPELLARIEQAEAALRALGFHDLRVRHHGDIARIEVGLSELAHAIGPARAAILAAVRAAGWRHVTLDLAGYRAGSTNPVRANT